MSYKFGIINYKVNNIGKGSLVSDFLTKNYQNTLAELLHINERGIIPIYDSDPDRDLKLLQSTDINKDYNDLIRIKESCNNLIRTRGSIQCKYGNKNRFSIASTTLDKEDKMTDNIEHCLRVVISAQDGNKKSYSALIHVPAYLLKYPHIQHNIAELISTYNRTIEVLELSNVECFVGGGSIEPTKQYSKEILEQQYEDGINLLAQILFENKLSHELVTGYKGSGKECIIIETQKQRAHILRPSDDISFNNQTML